MEKVKLNELADIYLGVTHTPEYVFEGVPFLSVKDISGGKICFDDCKYISKEEYDSLSEGAKPKVGDMLFCRVGTLGKPIIIPEGTPLFGSFVSLGYLRNRNSDRCDLNYLRYWMYSNSFWKQVNANVKGASQVNLNTGWLSKFDIDLPGIAEQRYRISVLDKCKSVIENREAELAALDDLIKARFVEMFGDPVINNKGWSESLIGDDCFVTKLAGFEYTQYINYDDSGDVVMVKAQNVKNGKLNRKELSFISNEVSDSLPRSQLEPGDIVMTSVGANIGDVAVIDDKYKYHLAPNVAKIRPDSEIYDSTYFMYMLMLLNTYIVKNSADTAKAALGMERIRKLKVFTPPIETQRQFADFVKQVDKSKVAVQKALEETQLLFDSLMQQYFG